MSYRTNSYGYRRRSGSDVGGVILRGIGIIFLVIFVIAAVIAIYGAISAFIAYLVMILWNFIALETHHAGWQLGFYVCWAGMALLSLLTNPFRIVTKIRSRD